MTDKPKKSRKAPGGGFIPGSEEVWTEEKTREVLKEVYNYLWVNPKICLLGELRANLQQSGIINSRTLRYLIDFKYKDNNEVSQIVQDLNEILEFRITKSKEIAPGIAAMLLKNKHGLVDKTEIKTDIGLDLKSLLAKPNQKD